MAKLHRLKTFVDGDTFRIVVESPRGSTIKLKHDPDLDVFTISRPLPLGIAYPCDWGFVPSTKGPDGDPIDAAVYWDTATFPGVVIACRAIALIKVEQNTPNGSSERRRNDRIVAVPVDARRQSDLTAVGDLPKRVRDELEHFFVSAAALEGKDPKILGWDGAASALELIRSSSA